MEIIIERKHPAPGTVIGAIFKALRRGEKLNPKDAWLNYGTSRLAAVIHQLKEYGWQIASETIQVVTASGRIASVSQYEMMGIH